MNLTLINSHLDSIRDRLYARLAKRRDKVSAFVASVLGPIVDRLVNLEPLPAWTNLDLLVFGCGVWTYAILLNWYADNLVFVATGFVILATWGAVIFARVESEAKRHGRS